MSVLGNTWQEAVKKLFSGAAKDGWARGKIARIEQEIAGLPSGGPVYRAFDIAYNTSGLTSGHTIYTPAIGDLLLDAWVEVKTPWNGTTPLLDIGQFLAGATQGWYRLLATVGGDATSGLAIDLTLGEQDSFQTVGNSVLGNSGQVTNLSYPDLIQTIVHTGVTVASPIVKWPTIGLNLGSSNLPGRFSAADPIKVVVSQTGQVGGADPSATQGAATVYIVTVTPTR